MSAAPNDPHQSLAVDKVSSITSPEASRAREPPSQENSGSDAENGSHSQDSSLSSDGPPTPAPRPKDENFADRVDKVPIAGTTDAFTAIREPKHKGVLVESEDDDEEEEDDDDDDDDDGFIPRGLPSRPTGSAANAGLRPVKAGR